MSRARLNCAPATRIHDALADRTSSKSKPTRQEACKQSLGAAWSRPFLRRQRDQARIVELTLPARPQISRPAVREEFQATVRSATSTLPFVSGLNSTATRKMAKPTTVVTRIGPDRAT